MFRYSASMLHPPPFPTLLTLLVIGTIAITTLVLPSYMDHIYDVCAPAHPPLPLAASSFSSSPQSLPYIYTF